MAPEARGHVRALLLRFRVRSNYNEVLRGLLPHEYATSRHLTHPFRNGGFSSFPSWVLDASCQITPLGAPSKSSDAEADASVEWFAFAAACCREMKFDYNSSQPCGWWAMRDINRKLNKATGDKQTEEVFTAKSLSDRLSISGTTRTASRATSCGGLHVLHRVNVVVVPDSSCHRMPLIYCPATGLTCPGTGYYAFPLRFESNMAFNVLTNLHFTVGCYYQTRQKSSWLLDNEPHSRK